MIESIVVVVIIVLIFLYVLKAGLFLQLFMEVPFFDIVTGVVSKYMDMENNIPIVSSDDILNGILETFLFLVVFTVIDEILKQFIYVGKHARLSLFDKILKKPIIVIGRYCISVFFTIIVSKFINDWLYIWLGESLLLVKSLSFVSILALVVLAFFLMNLTLTNFFIISLGKVFSTIVKLIATEFLVVFSYATLNFPEIYSNVSTSAVMIIGIVACVGSVIGNSFFEEKLNDKYDKRY